jgi:REP element-mobilizing transposase RayT
MLLSIPPSLSVSRAVQHLTGRSSHKLLNEFGLRKRYFGQHLWASGYWVPKCDVDHRGGLPPPVRSGRRSRHQQAFS